MAKENESTEAAAPPRKGGMMTWILLVIVGLASAGAGFALPQLLGGADAQPADDAAHGAKAPKSEHGELGLACLSFGEVVANLDDNRMMRYVRAKFSLSVDKKDCDAVQHLVEENKTILKNWLIGYLQNKQIEEVRGTEGFNRIRREIQERFNEVLFPDGEEKIKEILFDEFNVQ
jgi:flagellar basal body-associated protein FliL